MNDSIGDLDMNKKVIISIAVTLVLVTIGLLYMFAGNMDEFVDGIPSVERTQFMDHGDDLRNVRYAEIVPVYRKGVKLYIEIYNTIEHNDVPQDLWDKLDASEMAKQYGAEEVLMNGPRYWVINAAEGNTDRLNNKIANFGGIEMKLVATLDETLFSMNLGENFYTESLVERETNWIYHADNMVYELVSPDGDIYRMQAASQIIDPDLTIDKLEHLGNRLELPEGWSYRARVLEEDSVLHSNGMATIIQDEFVNTYQKVID
jgi:hypothetical protein